MSWQQLLDIYQQDAYWLQFYRSQPPVACPNDGTPLDVIGSIRHCPMGDYMWPRDGTR